jgi:hypothetical protein
MLLEAHHPDKTIKRHDDHYTPMENETVSDELELPVNYFR